MDDIQPQPLQTLRAASFRRPRSGRACSACHSRRIRCDAATRGMPCTNCAAFLQDCYIPPRKKANRRKSTNLASENESQNRSSGPEGNLPRRPSTASSVTNSEEFVSLLEDANHLLERQPKYSEMYLKLVKEEETKTAIHDPGRVAYLDEFSNLSLLLHDYEEPSAVHYPIPKLAENTDASTRCDSTDLEILRRMGAFSLPPKQLCDDLVYAFFRWVAPIAPIINRNSFLKRYRDPENPPSILLLQAILLAGSRVCSTPSLMDSNGSPIPAASLFYQRAKALYNAEYEEDRITIIQALILLGWHWEDPGKVTKDVFYWNGIAILIAQGCGMHRDPKKSALDPCDKRLWRRIWWTLVTRDRSVAVAVGRPMHIDLTYSDVDMISDDDFVDEDGHSGNPIHIKFFTQYIKLSKILEIILRQNYSISTQRENPSAATLEECEQLLEEWQQDCPAELEWNPNNHRFWAAYLNCIYYTTVTLLYRSYLPPPSKTSTYSTTNPSDHAAIMITSIVESLVVHKEIKVAPPFIIYSILSSLLIQIYEIRVTEPGELTEVQERRILLCLDSLRMISEVWLVAKVAENILELLLDSMGYDRLLKSSADDKARNLKVKSETMGHADKTSQSPEPVLTPALVAHVHAALGSSVEPPEEKEPSISKPALNFTQDLESWQGRTSSKHTISQVTPTYNIDLLGSHSFDWLDSSSIANPVPTGLDVNQWFENFFRAGDHDE